MAERKDPVTNTGANSDQIRAEIERTRADMDETFDALEAKLTPGQLLGEVWNLTKGGSTAGASKLWRIAKEYPMPAAVIGLGLGWLLVESSRGEGGGRSPLERGRGPGNRYDYAGRSGRYAGSYGYGAATRYDTDFDAGFDDEPGGSEGRLSSAAHTAKDTVSGAAHNVKEAVTGAASSVRDAATGAKERVGEAAGRARYRASELRGQAGSKARQARLGFWQQMEQNPLACGAATLALGILAGLTLPSSRREDELLGETRDRLLEDVKERGQEILDKGKQVAQAAVDTVKHVAEDEGLTVEGVAEKVRTVGREAKHAVKDEARRQELVPGTSEGQGHSGRPEAQGAGPAAGEFSGTGSAAQRAGSPLGGGAPATPAGGSSTPSPTVGGTPGAGMGSAGGPAGRGRKAGGPAREEPKVEETEPELVKR